MNKTNLFVMLATMLISFASCTSDVMEVMDSPAEKGYYTVNFSIGNPSKVQSRAYDQLEGNINQLYAVVFDGTGIADVANLTGNEALKDVYMVDIKKNNDVYDCMFRMDQSGKFVVCFVANSNTELVNAIKGADNITAFKALVAALNPETFLMVSQEFHLFELTDMAQEVDLVASNADASTEILMKRMVARIDIKNYVDDLNITSITFKNRAIKSKLWNDNTNSTADDYLEDAKVYSTTVNGNSTEPGLYEAEIYTYEQLNSTGKVPSLEFGYTLGTTNYNVELSLEFKKEGNYVMLKRNYKYTVNIRMSENKVRFTIDVMDWDTGETFTLTPEALADKETENRPDQTMLNQALKAYSLFVKDPAAQYNVASIASDGTVTFETELDNNDDASSTNTDNFVGGYYTYEAAMGLTGLNVNGKNYRLPTGGELKLLLPIYHIPNTVSSHPWWNDGTSNTNNYVLNENEFKETVNLEDAEPDDNGYIYWDTSKSFAGWSQMKLGTDDQKTVVTYGNKSYNVRPVYAYRFKGTDQYAAYRWESCKLNPAGSDTERYFSIKIKALDNYHDADITVEEIADEDFWVEGDYIEVKFPASGYYTTNGTLSGRGVNGSCWASSRYSATQAHFISLRLGDAYVGNGSVNAKFSLRLVPQE